MTDSTLPRWWSERVAATGSAKSDGIRRQLGAPRMDPLSVLVRESAQNSWDARDEAAGGVRYGIGLRRLGENETDFWKARLCPGPEQAAIGIDELFGDGRPTLMIVSDRGTLGLGGPLRADEVGPGETGADFVNLLRNIGEPRDREYGGGTYGFGKGALYTSSSIGTILVRTRCRWGGRLQTRLIGAALGFGFHKEGKGHTGRHWWGDIVDGVPDPVLDDEAEALAAELGLPAMEPGVTGTDIAIIGARLGSRPGGEDDDVDQPRSLRQAGEFLASAMMWNLWPLLLTDEHGIAPMRCHVTADGEPIAMPDPTQEFCILPFVEAYRALPRESTVISRKRPHTDIGRFAARRYIAPVRHTPAELAAPFDGNAHHCARMREPRLVVDYLPGPLMADETSHYGAVFVVDREHDGIFADAEPPTHDAWVWENLEDRNERGIVKRAHEAVKTALEVFVHPEEVSVAGIADQPPLGALAGRLATLLPTAHGPGAGERRDTPGSGRGGGGRAGAQIVDSPRMMRLAEGPRLVVRFRVDQAASPVTVKVSPTVALDIGSESEPPAGAEIPVVLEMRAEGGRVSAGDSVTVQTGDPREWTAIIMPARGAAAKVKLVVIEGERS